MAMVQTCSGLRLKTNEWNPGPFRIWIFFCNLQKLWQVFLFEFFTNHCTIVLCLIFVFRSLEAHKLSPFSKKKKSSLFKTLGVFLEDVFLLSFWKGGRFPIWTSLVAVPPIASRATPPRGSRNRRVSFSQLRDAQKTGFLSWVKKPLFKWKWPKITWLNEVILRKHPTFIWGEIT